MPISVNLCLGFWWFWYDAAYIRRYHELLESSSNAALTVCYYQMKTVADHPWHCICRYMYIPRLYKINSCGYEWDPLRHPTCRISPQQSVLAVCWGGRRASEATSEMSSSEASGVPATRRTRSNKRGWAREQIFSSIRYYKHGWRPVRGGCRVKFRCH